MGLFDGKKGVIFGVANENSIAWAIASRIMAEGGLCGFSHLPDRADDERQRNRRRVSQLTDSQPNATFLLPVDVSKDDDIQKFVDCAGAEFGKIDFLLHSVAFALTDDLAKPTIQTSREGFKLAMDISAYSLLAMCRIAEPIMNKGGSILAMTYFGGEKVVPRYNVMGICKAALDACVKYASFDLGLAGVRVNAISAGPLRTLAARAVGSDGMEELYREMAPMGENITHDDVANSGAFLLSSQSSGITGEILHVDNGYNIMGTPGRLLDRLKK
ncbi:MAG: enoyl-ACP reductase [Pirellulales bacterium]|nr:enoyl-ACP reductase [Pirellulales bacterium]